MDTKTKAVKQTGLLFKFQETDFMLGDSRLSATLLKPDGDWREFLPSGEKQRLFGFDTMSCTTFSAMNLLETMFKFFLKNGKFSNTQIKKMEELGVLKNGEFNFSDRFTAIMSSTTPNGNYFQNVWNSVKNDGLLAEADFPFAGNSWADYHDKTKITQAMKDKAAKMKDIFEMNYEWVTFQPDTTGLMNEAIKYSPIHAGIPFPAYHAILLPKIDYIFDSYDPFLYARNVAVNFSMKIIISIKTEPVPTTPSYTYFSAKEVAQWKLKDELWKLLDVIRGECGFPFKITSGLRTKAENDLLPDAVSDSAHLSGLAVDISCIDSAQRYMIDEVARKHGVKRIGIGKTFVHLDIDPSKPQKVMWHYY